MTSQALVRSRDRELEIEGDYLCQSPHPVDTSSREAILRKPPQTLPSSGDQVFKCLSPQGILLTQTALYSRIVVLILGVDHDTEVTCQIACNSSMYIMIHNSTRITAVK